MIVLPGTFFLFGLFNWHNDMSAARESYIFCVSQYVVLYNSTSGCIQYLK